MQPAQAKSIVGTTDRRRNTALHYPHKLSWVDGRYPHQFDGFPVLLCSRKASAEQTSTVPQLASVPESVPALLPHSHQGSVIIEATFLAFLFTSGNYWRCTNQKTSYGSSGPNPSDCFGAQQQTAPMTIMVFVLKGTFGRFPSGASKVLGQKCIRCCDHQGRGHSLSRMHPRHHAYTIAPRIDRGSCFTMCVCSSCHHWSPNRVSLRAYQRTSRRVYTAKSYSLPLMTGG